ncbi:MAG TPA: M56 family metallopeptidase [Panacibacter sp.]|nr:M56 family metallopeptidase [Panacibacter sp.]HNP46082.1 M56 family metallopeptidase [Panacibacter sp.]
MQPVMQSAFFQALGYAIANSLWQAAVLWLLATIINNVGKPSAARKYRVAVIAQFAGFIWFLFTLNFYYTKSTEVLQQVKLNESLGTVPYFYEPTVDSFSSGLSFVLIKAEQWLPYLSLAYLVMLVFLCIRFARAFFYTSRIRHKGLHKADVDLRLFVKRTAAALGIKKEVFIYYSELVKGPLTIGFLKPLILIPVASINNLSTEQVEAILLHELAHIKRLDFLLNIIQSVVELTLFFNPFIQLLGKEIKRERENSCDDWVLQFQYKPAMYAEALLQIAIYQSKPALAMNASSNKGDLLPRVKRMLNKQEKNHRYRNQVFSLILITIMLSTVAWLQPATKNTTPRLYSNGTVKKIKVEPLAANINNAWFSPFTFFTNSFRDKAAEIAPEVKHQINTAVSTATDAAALTETITPLALESLNSAYDQLTVALEQAASDLDKEQAAKDKATVSENNETEDPAIKINADEMIKAELAKVDWKQIGTDLKGAVINIPDNKLVNLGMDLLPKKQLKDAYENVLLQINNLAVQQKDQGNKQKLALTKLEAARSMQEEKIVATQKLLNKQVQQRIDNELKTKRNKSASDIADSVIIDKAIEKVYNSVFGTISNKTYSDITDLYTPTVYNDNYSYTYTEHLNNVDSALIIIRPGHDNADSHIKKVILQIIGNNGLYKTYELSAEVYQ